MTLRYDLSLAHRAKRLAPAALIIAGGMEATFKPERMFELGPPLILWSSGKARNRSAKSRVACAMAQDSRASPVPRCVPKAARWCDFTKAR